MKKVVVTGGAGFIGSHLVDRLLKEKRRVVAIDNLSNGALKNLERARSHPLFSFYRADVSNRERIRPLFRGADTVFHLAALADIVPSVQRPADYFRANVDGTLSVMECARHAGVRQVLYAASSSCYGIPDRYPTPEGAGIRPQYPYALTKFLGEQIVLHWGQVYKIKANSLRFFNVYGPRARTNGTYGAVFKVFLPQKIHGMPFTIVGDGRQTRDFTYVADVVEAFSAVANSELKNQVMNVGSGKTVSVNTIIRLLGGGKTVRLPKRPGEPDRTFADISKIKKLTGWKPRVSIENGIRMLLKHLDDFQDLPVWTPDKIEKATQDWFYYLEERG
ncbi:MAG: SDR family oxidoreductase [Candidatus Omnitrophica bacterium]|nr:SDR family oxidoreductase [Candidatus Omnitrophota bacterium]